MQITISIDGGRNAEVVTGEIVESEVILSQPTSTPAEKKRSIRSNLSTCFCATCLLFVTVQPVNMFVKAKIHGVLTVSANPSPAPQFIIPVANHYVSSNFGKRPSPGGVGSTDHKGIDLAAPAGTPILAAKDGTVVSAKPNGGYGNEIVLKHDELNGKSLLTQYAHLSEIKVTPGQQVKQGEVIGLMGSTGNSTGSHLHFEIRTGGVAVDPRSFITFKAKGEN